MNRRCYLSTLALALVAAGCDAQLPRPSTRVPTSDGVKVVQLERFHDDFAVAREEAASKQKPLLIYFTADWCSYCRQLEREVFEKPEFRAAAESFVCVRVDAGRQTGRCEEYRVRAYPTLVLTGPSGTAIERIVGLTTPGAVLAQMNAAATSVVAALPEPPATTLHR